LNLKQELRPQNVTTLDRHVAMNSSRGAQSIAFALWLRAAFTP
jgi:hypothetical protein